MLSPKSKGLKSPLNPIFFLLITSLMFGSQVSKAGPASSLCGANYLSLASKHESTKTINFRELRGPVDLLAATRRQVGELARTENSAERQSISHQDDVNRFTGDQAVHRLLNVDPVSMELGIHNSDMGKLGVYKKLLMEASFKSDFLFYVLKGDSNFKSSEVVSEFLAEIGFAGKTLLNRNLANDDIRQIFQEVPALTGFLHALPGTGDAFLAFETGAIDKAQLKRQLGANLFHNGPAKGFWKLLQDVFIPGAVKKALEANPNLRVNELFDGTVYQAEAGNIEYPFPQTAEGVFHTIGDRLSQATKGGVVKIFYEITAFAAPTTAVGDLLLLNPRSTSTQIDAVIDYLCQKQPNEYIAADQIQNLTIVAKIARERIARHIQAVDQLVQNADDVRAALSANPMATLPEIVIGGRKFTAEQMNTPGAKEELIGYVEQLLLQTEAEYGDPMRAITPEDIQGYNDRDPNVSLANQ